MYRMLPRPPRRIVGVGEVNLSILDRPAGRWPRRRTLTFRAELLYDDGSTAHVSGELDPLLDFATRTRLHAALDALRENLTRRLVPGAQAPRPRR